MGSMGGNQAELGGCGRKLKFIRFKSIITHPPFSIILSLNSRLCANRTPSLAFPRNSLYWNERSWRRSWPLNPCLRRWTCPSSTSSAASLIYCSNSRGALSRFLSTSSCWTIMYGLAHTDEEIRTGGGTLQTIHGTGGQLETVRRDRRRQVATDLPERGPERQDEC